MTVRIDEVSEKSPGPVGAMIRDYSPLDLEACLEVFDSNVPRFFKPNERDEFRSFLHELPGPYLVLVTRGGRVAACGGYAINRDDGSADLCWGMVREDLHGTGLGRRLTRRRIELSVRDPRVREVCLHTSQHTAGFYERLGLSTIGVLEDGYAPGLHRCDMRMSVVDGQLLEV